MEQYVGLLEDDFPIGKKQVKTPGWFSYDAGEACYQNPQLKKSKALK